MGTQGLKLPQFFFSNNCFPSQKNRSIRSNDSVLSRHAHFFNWGIPGDCRFHTSPNLSQNTNIGCWPVKGLVLDFACWPLDCWPFFWNPAAIKGLWRLVTRWLLPPDIWHSWKWDWGWMGNTYQLGGEILIKVIVWRLVTRWLLPPEPIWAQCGCANPTESIFPALREES